MLSHKVLGGCSCLLFGDFGQLPPVFDLPLYTTLSRSIDSDLGRAAYQAFDKAVTLTQVMRQSGQDQDQVRFRELLLQLRDSQVTQEDWELLMTRSAANVADTRPFENALHLHPLKQSVAEHNALKLRQLGRPVAAIKAIHSGTNASKATTDDAQGLEPIVHLSHGARVMLIANLWVEAGLVNGAMGTVHSICYRNGGPPSLPICILVQFDGYTGPTFHENTVPIPPIRRTWLHGSTTCSRLQIPLKLSWAVTIHKSQGLTLDKVVVDIGKKEFCTGITFVACSRVRRLTDMVFSPPFDYQRIANLGRSERLQERLREDQRLSELSA